VAGKKCQITPSQDFDIVLLIKIGGGVAINVEGIVSDLADRSEKYVIVHGANAFRDKLAAELGKPKKTLTSASGYTSVFSDESAIDILMMAYAGLRNKRIVELCQRHGINAVGLTGLDGRIVQGRRNQGIRIREDGKLRIVRDFSGKPQHINRGLLDSLLEQNYVPVLSVPIIDENGFAINSENDDIVSVLQQTYQASKIIQFIEARGFLADRDNPDSLIAHISPADLARREEQVDGRMKRKMLALRKLFDHGANTVIISDGRVEHPLRDALSGSGTTIA
jgi:acetylglutamate/LysW-gamma-L-alpha-aminoadipate kinase